MSAIGYESLRTAKAALDEGLINAADFDCIKSAVLRAQQIKAGLDAGFIREADYQNVKLAFLHSLNLSADPVAAAIHPANGLQNSTSTVSSLGGGIPKAPSLPPSFSQTAAPDVPVQTSAATERSLGTPQSSLSAMSAQPTGQTQIAAPSRDPSPGARATIPTNIPKMGGARPKQSGSTSMSGISITDDSVNLYYYLKAKSVYRWAIWRINESGNQVIISAVGDKDSSYQDFLASLPASDCRYGVIDMKFTNSEGCIFNKILFINWAPDSARIKAKMMYASTKDFFKGYLDGLSMELQGSDLDEISEQEANNAVRSSVTRQ